jgi:NAD(P)-dependent dehydrogenase (short-subunit alcohol dehydrogenase family)
MARAELLERYRALPLPTTKDEPWRFTDLRGFDPDSFGRVPGTVPGTAPAQTMLDIAVSGLATVTESSIEIERAPDGITFEPLADHPRLHELVGWNEKFAAHNAAAWRHGLLVHVPRGAFGEVEEIAKAALFLASDDSSFVNASAFMVDGGITGAYVTPL